MFACNSSKHTSTGYQPFELVFGRQISIPSGLTKPAESQEIAKNRLINNKEKSKERYDEKSHSVPR